jgi:hypothetical protein
VSSNSPCSRERRVAEYPGVLTAIAGAVVDRTGRFSVGGEVDGYCRKCKSDLEGVARLQVVFEGCGFLVVCYTCRTKGLGSGYWLG